MVQFGLSKMLETPSPDGAPTAAPTSAPDAGPGRAAVMQSRVGSHFYASPELLRDEPYDASIDFWGLGHILFMCVTGIHRCSNSGSARKLSRSQGHDIQRLLGRPPCSRQCRVRSSRLREQGCAHAIRIALHEPPSTATYAPPRGAAYSVAPIPTGGRQQKRCQHHDVSCGHYRHAAAVKARRPQLAWPPQREPRARRWCAPNIIGGEVVEVGMTLFQSLRGEGRSPTQFHSKPLA